MEPLIVSGFLFYNNGMHMGIFSGGILGFLSGIILGMFFMFPDILNEWRLIITGVVVLSFLIMRITNYQVIIPILISVLLGLIVGFWRTHQFHERYPFGTFSDYQEKVITVIGKVSEPPKLTPVRQTVLIVPKTINGKAIETKMIISVRTSPLEEYRSGDYVRVTGKFQLRSDFISETDRQVSYRMMSYSKKILGDINFPTSLRIIGHESIITTWLSSMKNKFTESLHTIFILPGSGLLSGMMLGDTSAIDYSILDAFRMVGLIHIVVLSGYNITLITHTFIKIFAFRGYFGRLQLALGALVLFIGIVGISATALRAGIMAACVSLARYFVRPAITTRVLLITLAIMVFFSPYALLFDLSLQLSFLATIGIVYLFPYFQEKFPRLAEGTFSEIVLQTIAVNCVVLPLILYQIGTISPVFLPVNVLVLGFIPFLTIGGFVITSIGVIAPKIALVAAYPVQFLADMIIAFADWTAQHDPFFTTIPQFSLTILILVYGVIFGFLVFITKKQVD